MNYQNAIKKLRDRLILTQQEFAELLGVTYVSISRWENGKFEPTMKIRRKIAELCKEYNIELED